jgi:hypothetical protein
MAMQQTTPTAVEPTETAREVSRHGRSGIWVQVAMTVISLAVVCGFVIWQVMTDGEEADRPTALVAGGQGTVMAGASEAAPVTDQEMYQQRRAAVEKTAVSATPTIFIVSSRGDLAETFAILGLARNMLDAGFDRPGPVEVVWLSDAEAEASFWAAHGAKQLRDGVTYSVIDLRTAGGGGSSMCDIQVGPADC